MKISLIQSLVPYPTQKLVQQTRNLDKILELMDYWESEPKGKISFEYKGRTHEIEYVLAPQSFLNYMKYGEKFGGYLGDMVFINSDMVKKNSSWLPYVALKLYAERFVDEGKDQTGRVKHLESLLKTMKLAGATMPQEELNNFIGEIRKEDSSGMFDLLEEDYKKFLESGNGNPKDAKRAYLEKHHNNLWVRRGREAESLNQIGIYNDGYRNHSEVILNYIPRLSLENQYLFASFIQEIKSSPDGSQFKISQPFTEFAYALTKECNGFVDLVEFDEKDNPKELDIITKLPKKEKTWKALSKRLSYNIHKAERASRELIESEKKKLEGIVLQIGNTNNQINNEMNNLRALVTQNPFEDLTLRLKSLGNNYLSVIEGFKSESDKIIGNLAGLEELSKALESRI